MIIFSENLIKTLEYSIILCQKEQGPLVTPSHLLKALEKTKGGLAFGILSQIKPINQEAYTFTKKDNKQLPEFNNDTNIVLKKAASIAFEYGHHYIGTEHVLAALLELPVNKIAKYKLPADRIKKHLETVLNSSSHIPDFSKIFKSNHSDIGAIQNEADSQSTLQRFTIDLTAPKNHKDLNPIIGRQPEIQRLIQVLSRKDKNNPVILGDAGVGKTALVEGLARKIFEKQVPPCLYNKQILSLDLGLLVAGTMYRGEFENRLKLVMQHVEDNLNIILFIDELHNIIGAGSAQGSMDAANLLKPLLSRGRLRCIGATTSEEYKKHIESDPALERRFQAVNLSEPLPEETLEILQGVKNNYQNFHGVSFTNDAIEAAVELSVRYIQDKFLPDKAIDLIDESAAKVKIQNQGKDKLLQQEIELENELKKIYKEKEKALISENFNQALKIKKQEEAVQQKLKKIQQARQTKLGQKNLKVTRKDILDLVSQKTNIPINELNSSEFKRLNLITKKIKKTIIGQTQQIDQIMKTIIHAKLGFTDENKPLASILLLGPSGVGKTYFAQDLPKALFKKSEAFIQLDMSEFNEKFQATKLIGSPAGYIGFREGNKFTDLVKKNPHSLILLDEIEKAHPDVLDLLLQILDHGHLTDSTGKKVNFKNTIIVMTSNALSDKLQKGTIGFHSTIHAGQQDHAELISELKKKFKPELINRLNQVVIFNSLSEKDLQKVTKLELQKLQQRLSKNSFDIEFNSPVINLIGRISHQQNSGARGVQATIKTEIEHLLLDKIISKQKNKFKVTKERNKIVIQ